MLPRSSHLSLNDQSGPGGTHTHFPISEDTKRSPMVPPATDRNAEPQKPVMKRNVMRMADGRKECKNQRTMFWTLEGGQHAPALGANATGQEKMKKPANDPRYTIFRPGKEISGRRRNEDHVTYHVPRTVVQPARAQLPNPSKRGTWGGSKLCVIRRTRP